MDDNYDINYTCGCVHEIEIVQGQHQPTGKGKICKEHTKNE